MHRFEKSFLCDVTKRSITIPKLVASPLGRYFFHTLGQNNSLILSRKLQSTTYEEAANQRV